MSSTVLENVVNGVSLASLGEAVTAIQQNPRAGDYAFTTETEWKNGAVSNTRIFRWVKEPGQEKAAQLPSHEILIDEPQGLLGSDSAANPVETILAGLAGCLAIGISYNAAARGINIESLKIRSEGFLNLQGFLGLDASVRPGYDRIGLKVSLKTDADESAVASLLQHVKATSPVLDIISNPVPVTFELS